MALGSLIGFGLLFILVTWLSSAAAGVLLVSTSSSIRARGSAAEKRAAALALVMPPVLGAAVTLSLAGYSLFPQLLGDTDHCDTHGHHLHLCLIHGEEWARQILPLSVIAGPMLLVLFRLSKLVQTLFRARRRLRLLESVSEPVADQELPLFRAPSNRPFCFVAGLRAPRIFVASGLWSESSDPERRAMLGHEHSHVANGDLWRSPTLAIFGLFHAPLVAGFLRRRWNEAAERLCDRMAADRTGDSSTVAAALLRLARGPQLVGAISFVPKPESVADRIVAVLSQERTGHSLATRFAHAGLLLLTTALCITAATAGHLHHAFERLFTSI